jgi:hypothetical protein
MPRPRGRPPLSRAIYSFEDLRIELPAAAAVDTSFVVDALLVSQPLHAPCAEYLAQLAEAGTRLVYNQLLLLELEEAAFKIALRERYGRTWRRGRDDVRPDGALRPDVIRRRSRCDRDARRRSEPGHD